MSASFSLPYLFILSHFPENVNMIKLWSRWIYPPLYLRQYVKFLFFSRLPSLLILAGDKSIAIHDSFVAAGRPLLPCLAVIPVDSFRSVSLFKSCCNYTGFSICRRPDMIQTTTTGRGKRGAQRVNEKRDKNTMARRESRRRWRE